MNKLEPWEQLINAQNLWLNNKYFKGFFMLLNERVLYHIWHNTQKWELKKRIQINAAETKTLPFLILYMFLSQASVYITHNATRLLAVIVLTVMH